jgi:hypothetical protein
VNEIKSGIRALAKKYRDAEIYRTRHLDRFLGEDGKVLPGKVNEHDRAFIDNAYDAQSDLIDLVAELEKLVGPELKVGTAVIVPADATTVNGDVVNFEGEVTGEVYELEDSDGDVLVRSGGLVSYVDPRQLKLVE